MMLFFLCVISRLNGLRMLPVDNRRLLINRADYGTDCSLSKEVNSLATQAQHTKTGCKGAIFGSGHHSEGYCKNAFANEDDGFTALTFDMVGGSYRDNDIDRDGNINQRLVEHLVWYAACCQWGNDGGNFNPDPSESKGCKRLDSTAEGDPHITNIMGVKFDILALGSFSFLDISSKSKILTSRLNMLKVEGMITRVTSDCHQTFIERLSLSGNWIMKMLNSSMLEIRAVANVPLEDALELSSSEGIWKSFSYFSKILDMKLKDNKIFIRRTIGVEVSVDQHWGWNYLNLAIKDLDLVYNENFDVRGLLIQDDFTAAATAPSDCLSFSQVAKSNGPSFFSSVELLK